MRILSIDGGGIRGLIPALVLAEFEKRTGTSIAKRFDLIAGTSTGGILALALAAGTPAARLADFYLEKGPAIFSRTLKKRLESAGGLLDELYDAGELEIGLVEIFGQQTMSQACETMAMAVAYDIEGRETVVFRSWDLDGNDCRMADVARATSAAPTFFEPHVVTTASGLTYPCIDGGVVANNPALLALAEVFHTAHKPRLLSLGTGKREVPFLLEDARDAGLARWAPHLLDIMFDGGAELVDRQCRELLGDRYVRLQATLPEDVAMDATDAQAVAAMRLAAKEIIDGASAQAALRLLEDAA